MDASEIYSKRLNAKEVIFPQEGEFTFPIADGRIKTPGGDQELRTSTLIRPRPIQGEGQIDFHGESEGSLPQPHDSLPDAGEAINDFWSMSGSFIYRHHVEPRVKLYSPREESFPIPMKHIDVTRTAHTNKRSALMIIGNGLKKIFILTTHENCVNLFHRPEDKEFEETIKNARKKLETSVAPAMPCKIMKNCRSGGSDKKKTKLACILEADESTRMRMGNSIPHYHQDHIAGKGENSLQHYNLVRKFIPMPQAMKIPAAKAAMDQEWEKLEKISAWNLTNVKSKKQVIDEARTSGATVHFASLMDTCHFKKF